MLLRQQTRTDHCTGYRLVSPNQKTILKVLTWILSIEGNLAIIFTQQLLLLLRKLIHFRVSKEDFQMFYCS